MPEFKAAGLASRYDSYSRMFVPTFEGLDAFGAAERFFDLSDEDAELLFNPAKAALEIETPSEVAKLIRAYVADPEDAHIDAEERRQERARGYDYNY